MNPSNTNDMTLALSVGPRGFGFVVFEDPDLAVEWGIKGDSRCRLRDSVLRAEVLLHMVAPSVVVMEDTDHESSRRCKEAGVFLDKVAALAKGKGIKVVRCSRDKMLRTFAQQGAKTKDDVMAKVAAQLPELSERLPARRRVWESEGGTTPIFEAAAFALTYFEEKQGKSR